MIIATTPTTNERNGNGKYSGLRRRKKKASANITSENLEEFKYFDTQDLTMKFNKAKDPIYFVFDCMEKRSVMQLMGDFVKDSIFEVTNLFS